MKHLEAARQNARNGTELGDLRSNTAAAARQGCVERGEVESYEAAVRARAVELWIAGRVEEARALVARELA